MASRQLTLLNGIGMNFLLEIWSSGGIRAGILFCLLIAGTPVVQGAAANPNVPPTDAGNLESQTQATPIGNGPAGKAVPWQAAVQAQKPELQRIAASDREQTATPSSDVAEAGAKVFKKCARCHTTEKGGASKVGPNLWNIIERPIASVEGYSYSKALKAARADTWTFERLDRFLANPRKAIKGNKMAFNGLRKEKERRAVIAFLGGAVSGDVNKTDAIPVAANAEAPGNVTATPAIDPLGLSAADIARIERAVAELEAILPTIDYESARYHPLHFPPAISSASDQECLVCHKEILDNKPLEKSPAGVEAAAVIAWYQTLDTYDGEQMTFHQRHLTSPFAKKVMNLTCNFCHQGNDPREEHPDLMPAGVADADTKPPFTLRKMVNPSETCLLCHGAFPDPENIMGLPGPWPEARLDFESEDAPNGCLTCHEETFRTQRHRVTYLKAASIEEAAKNSSDTCYGCHGGRAWYRNSYPYPRTPWPDMDTETTPEWAVDRPTHSDPRYALPSAQ